MNQEWRPSASLQTLKARAGLLREIRGFFHSRGVMEVDTPILSRHATVDRHIESFELARGFLHTSPEFPMKRLLAAGSGPIYQLCHVFRSEPARPLHNPEFLMLEWYRPGWDAPRLMDEAGQLLQALGVAGSAPLQRFSYRDAFRRVTAPDPFTASLDELKNALPRFGVAAPEGGGERDFWLDLWMGAVVGPKLGLEQPCFVYDFPASQAALARVRPAPSANEPPLAERFELFWKGVELANGFHELTDAAEQRRRFEADQAWRCERGLKVPPFDANLIAALEAGLPQSAGVALGVDRLLMLKLGLADIAQAMPFGQARA